MAVHMVLLLVLPSLVAGGAGDVDDKHPVSVGEVFIRVVPASRQPASSSPSVPATAAAVSSVGERTAGSVPDYPHSFVPVPFTNPALERDLKWVTQRIKDAAAKDHNDGPDSAPSCDEPGADITAAQELEMFKKFAASVIALRNAVVDFDVTTLGPSFSQLKPLHEELSDMARSLVRLAAGL